MNVWTVVSCLWFGEWATYMNYIDKQLWIEKLAWTVQTRIFPYNALARWMLEHHGILPQKCHKLCFLALILLTFIVRYTCNFLNVFWLAKHHNFDCDSNLPFCHFNFSTINFKRFCVQKRRRSLLTTFYPNQYYDSSVCSLWPPMTGGFTSIHFAGCLEKNCTDWYSSYCNWVAIEDQIQLTPSKLVYSY